MEKKRHLKIQVLRLIRQNEPLPEPNAKALTKKGAAHDPKRTSSSVQHSGGNFMACMGSSGTSSFIFVDVTVTQDSNYSESTEVCKERQWLQTTHWKKEEVEGFGPVGLKLTVCYDGDWKQQPPPKNIRTTESLWGKLGNVSVMKKTPQKFGNVRGGHKHGARVANKRIFSKTLSFTHFYFLSLFKSTRSDTFACIKSRCTGYEIWKSKQKCSLAWYSYFMSNHVFCLQQTWMRNYCRHIFGLECIICWFLHRKKIVIFCLFFFPSPFASLPSLSKGWGLPYWVLMLLPDCSCRDELDWCSTAMFRSRREPGNSQRWRAAQTAGS